MSFLRLLARFSPKHPRSGRGRQGRGRRPPPLTVTALEDRLAPAVLTVNSLSDAPLTGSALTLRQALDLVNTGGLATDSLGNRLAVTKASQVSTANAFGSNDTIRFDPNLFGPTQQQLTLAGNELLLSRSVQIIGPGAGQLAVSGNNQSSVLEVATGATVRLSGLTIEGGIPTLADSIVPADGGGIVNNGTLTLADSTVSGNAASNGGGIVNNGILTLTGSTISGNTALLDDGGILNNGSLTLIDSNVSGNSAAVGNGGIGNYGDTLTLTASTVSGNSALGAGGVGNYAGTLTLSDSTVWGNSAVGGGGLVNTATLTLADSTVSGNVASNGGGIVNNGTLTLTGSTISGNVAQLNDGGILNNGALTLTDSTISGNSAAVGNGGIGSYGGSLTLTDSAVSGNSALGAGGIGNYAGTLTLSDSTVWGNSAVGGGGLVNTANLMLADSTVSGNMASNAGGIANSGTLMLTNSTVSSNAAQLNDGGILNSGTLTLSDSTVSGNAAIVGNGDIGNDGGTLMLTAGTVSGNSASGASDLLNTGMLTLTDSTAFRNSAQGSGSVLNSGPLSAGTSSIVAHSGDDLVTTKAFNNPGPNLTAPGDETPSFLLASPLQGNQGPSSTKAAFPDSEVSASTLVATPGTSGDPFLAGPTFLDVPLPTADREADLGAGSPRTIALTDTADPVSVPSVLLSVFVEQSGVLTPGATLNSTDTQSTTVPLSGSLTTRNSTPEAPADRNDGLALDSAWLSDSDPGTHSALNQCGQEFLGRSAGADGPERLGLVVGEEPGQSQPARSVPETLAEGIAQFVHGGGLSSRFLALSLACVLVAERGGQKTRSGPGWERPESVEEGT